MAILKKNKKTTTEKNERNKMSKWTYKKWRCGMQIEPKPVRPVYAYDLIDPGGRRRCADVDGRLQARICKALNILDSIEKEKG